MEIKFLRLFSGTYIKTLTQEFGSILECDITVKTLKRERIDIFALRLKDTGSASKIIEKLIPSFRIALILVYRYYK